MRNVGADFTGINGFPVVEIKYSGQQTEHVLARSAAGQGDVLKHLRAGEGIVMTEEAHAQR